MSKGGYKIRDQKACYFVTFQVVYWIDVFTRQTYRDIFLDLLRFYQENQGLKVHAYVIMSNHIHLILSASQSKNDLSSIIGRIKSLSSKKIKDEIEQSNESRKEWILWMMKRAASKHKRNDSFQLWTHDSHPILLDDNIKLKQRLDYIHQNPVKAGIVANAEDYIYSSAGAYAGLPSLIKIDFI
ncbi:MAG: transposase [Chitinophagales bacterium]